MAGNFVSNNCRVVPTRLTTTADTVCHTCMGYTQVVGVRIVNTHATATPVVNFKYKPNGSAITYFYQANYTLPVSSALWFTFDAFGASENDQLIVSSSIANAVDVFVLIAEVPGRSQ